MSNQRYHRTDGEATNLESCICLVIIASFTRYYLYFLNFFCSFSFSWCKTKKHNSFYPTFIVESKNQIIDQAESVDGTKRIQAHRLDTIQYKVSQCIKFIANDHIGTNSYIHNACSVSIKYTYRFSCFFFVRFSTFSICT